MNDLLDRFTQGDTRALARLITQVENREDGSFDLLRALFPKSGKAKIVGITGSPGSGKSTIVDRLAAAYLDSDARVGILAVDPSSPYTRGALLGDRIRMHRVESDPGVYIRSMATRGHLGGLAAATSDVVTVLDAADYDPVIVETVGVGQDEVDVVKLADVSVVVLVPGMGDDVQALKAGIMEIGDVFIINKCDLEGADTLERALVATLELASPNRPPPPIVRMVATEGEGVEQLRASIETSYAQAAKGPGLEQRRREAICEKLVRLLEARLVPAALESFFPQAEFDSMLDALVRREEDPYTLVDRILAEASFGRSE